MLKIGGILNIIIGTAHIIGLLWAKQMFEITGISEEMNRLAQTHVSLPYLLTVFVSIFFFIFGLYGLSGAGQIKPMPFVKKGTFVIAGIYLIRGLGELIFDIAMQEASPLAETIYSIIAISIGLLYLLGGTRLSSKRTV